MTRAISRAHIPIIFGASISPIFACKVAGCTRVSILDWHSRYVGSPGTRSNAGDAVCLDGDATSPGASHTVYLQQRRSAVILPVHRTRSCCWPPRCRSAWKAKDAPWTTFSPSGCADAHSFSLLEESNTTEAKVAKALPYRTVKAERDRSMEGKHSEGGTLS